METLNETSRVNGPACLPPRRRALLFANPKARRVRQGLDEARRCLEAAGIELMVNDLRSRSPEAVLQTASPPLDMVIVAGGDGTCNAVLTSLRSADLPLGILPLGTANDLARTLGIPSTIPGACEVIAAGNTRTIDLGRVNGRYFLNVASLGLSVSITQELTGEIKRRWGVLAYLWTAIRVMFRARSFTAEIRSEGRSQTVRTLQIAVGNGRFYGGGMTISEDARIDEQLLHLYSLEVKQHWHLVWRLRALWRGNFHGWSDIRTMEGACFEILTGRPRHITADGELLAKTPATIDLVPQCLKVFAPKSFD